MNSYGSSCGIFLTILLCLCLYGHGYAEDDIWPQWPDVSTFTEGGKGNTFRLPFFKNYFTYPNNEPLYFVLRLPKGYDAERSYPLAINFQPQGSAPGVWQMRQMAGEDAICLGVSWSMSSPKKGGRMQLRDTGAYHIPATVHWLMSQFKIDRERIFVGGFSAGGWAASADAMRASYRHISTHFVMLGAGVRGRPEYKYFQGRQVFLAAGTKDMNYKWSLKALAILQGKGLEVTHYAEQGGGHSVGKETRQALAVWFNRFNPRVHAEEWLSHATLLMQQKKPRVTQATQLLYAVAQLGPNSEYGVEARRRLEKIEGAALLMSEQAWSLLHAHKYGLAYRAFKEAGRVAKKRRLKRLMTVCARGIAEIAEWQMIEQVTLLDQCEFTDRPYQAYLLCQDGSKRLATGMKDFGGEIFKNNFNWYENIMKKMKKPPKARFKAQKDLVKLRLSVWSGKAVKNEKATEKTRKKLQKIIDSVGDAAEKREAEDLLGQLPVEEQFDIFGQKVE